VEGRGSSFREGERKGKKIASVTSRKMADVLFIEALWSFQRKRLGDSKKARHLVWGGKGEGVGWAGTVEAGKRESFRLRGERGWFYVSEREKRLLPRQSSAFQKSIEKATGGGASPGAEKPSKEIFLRRSSARKAKKRAGWGEKEKRKRHRSGGAIKPERQSSPSFREGERGRDNSRQEKGGVPTKKWWDPSENRRRDGKRLD